MSAKKTNKPKKKTAFDKKDVVAVLFSMVQEREWADITLNDIAQESGFAIADLYDHFEDKSDILVAFHRMIDRQVLADFYFEEAASPRERLFDLLMDRFEALQDYRDGLLPILDGFKYDPKQAVIAFPNLCQSMHWYLEVAGIQTNGIKGAVKIAGLTGFYLKILHVWIEDESPDLSKTMADLDKNLGRIENLAKSFRF